MFSRYFLLCNEYDTDLTPNWVQTSLTVLMWLLLRTLMFTNNLYWGKNHKNKSHKKTTNDDTPERFTWLDKLGTAEGDLSWIDAVFQALRLGSNLCLFIQMAKVPFDPTLNVLFGIFDVKVGQQHIYLQTGVSCFRTNHILECDC